MGSGRDGRGTPGEGAVGCTREEENSGKLGWNGNDSEEGPGKTQTQRVTG